MARYTHDLSQTTEPGGLFFNTPLPDLAATRTRVPGQVLVAQLTTALGSHTLNELSLQYSGNAIESAFAPNARSSRAAFALQIPELYPENRAGLIPQVSITGLSAIGANQPFDNSYQNMTLADSLSLQSGNHTLKAGILVALEEKNELSTSPTQGSFAFAAGGGRTAFQNFLTGNADGRCGAACSYAEPEAEVAAHLRWQRYEAFVQDSWRLRPGLVVDYGLRFAVYPGVVDAQDRLSNFVPPCLHPSAAPAWSGPEATTLVAGSGDFANGIVVAGRGSPYGRRIQRTEADRLQPPARLRVGHAQRRTDRDPRRLRGLLRRAARRDLPAERVHEPALRHELDHRRPAAVEPRRRHREHQAAAGRAVRDRQRLQPAADAPVQPRRPEAAAAPCRARPRLPRLARRPPDPAGRRQRRAAGGRRRRERRALNLARPYQGYASITMRQTTARSRYDALALSLRYEAGRSGTLAIAYTLGRSQTSATNDRDTIDLPQDRTRLDAEYALARNDRSHVFTANGVLELPFFRDGEGLAKALLGGWQLSGIVTFWSGPPISRVVTGDTNGGRRGSRLDAVGTPLGGLPASGPGYVYWFDPAAFAAPADGRFGDTGRAPFRLPGVSQWDLTLAKSWPLPHGLGLQLRADFINAFNHTQLDPAAIQNVCEATSGSCAVPGSSFGQITATRSPREIQLGLRLSWN